MGLDFHGDPVVKSLSFQHREHGFITWLRNISDARQCNKKNINFFFKFKDCKNIKLYNLKIANKFYYSLYCTF